MSTTPVHFEWLTKGKYAERVRQLWDENPVRRWERLVFIVLLWEGLVVASNRRGGRVTCRPRGGEGEMKVPIDARGLPMGIFDPLGHLAGGLLFPLLSLDDGGGAVQAERHGGGCT